MKKNNEPLTIDDIDNFRNEFKILVACSEGCRAQLSEDERGNLGLFYEVDRFEDMLHEFTEKVYDMIRASHNKV